MSLWCPVLPTTSLAEFSLWDSSWYGNSAGMAMPASKNGSVHISSSMSASSTIIKETFQNKIEKAQRICKLVIRGILLYRTFCNLNFPALFDICRISIFRTFWHLIFKKVPHFFDIFKILILISRTFLHLYNSDLNLPHFL